MKNFTIRFLTLVSTLSMMGFLSSCKPSAEEVATAKLTEVLAIPTIIIKGDGQALEIAEGQVEEIKENLVLIREVVVFDEEGVEDIVSLEWTSSTETNWSFKPKDGIIGIIEGVSLYLAIPLFPGFGEPSLSTSLTVTATLGEYSLQKTYNLLLPADLVDESLIPLIALDGTTSPAPAANDVIRVRGYVSRIMSDWNSAVLTYGAFGINIYRLDATGAVGTIEVGDYIQVTGKWALYNGMRQVSFVTRVRLVPLEASPLEPVANEVAEADFNATGLAGKDTALVRVEGLTYDAVKTASNGNTSLGGHMSIYMNYGATSILVYVNYHILREKQEGILNVILAAVDGATLNYEGALGWYFGPQLLPLEISDVTLVPAPAA